MLTLDCAKLIINRCIEVGHPISLLYLQRIMYLCQIGHIKLSGKLLFIEQFEAWQIGPMLRSVYNEYYAYGGWNIDHKQKYQEPILCLPFSLWKIVEHFSLVSPYEILNQVCNQTQAWKITYQTKGIKEEIDNSLLVEDAKNFDF